MTTSPIVRLKNVVKLYRGTDSRVPVRALDGIGMELMEKDFMIIEAPSGSGKTTLLRLMAALDTPTTGKVEIGGVDVGVMDQRQRSSFRLNNVSVLLDGHNLIPVLSAEENVEFPLRLQKVHRHERRKRVADALAAMAIDRRAARRRPVELSAGDQQRVAAARALASRPRLIVADEPTAKLDSATGVSIVELMHEVAASRGITIVIGTHDALLAKLAQRVVRLRDGRVVEDEMRKESLT